MTALEEYRRLLDDARNTQTGRLHISPRQALDAADAAIAEQTAIIEAMEQFIDGCTYHMKNGETVTYEGPRP